MFQIIFLTIAKKVNEKKLNCSGRQEVLLAKVNVALRKQFAKKRIKTKLTECAVMSVDDDDDDDDRRRRKRHEKFRQV
jgi:hypothetical protein